MEWLWSRILGSNDDLNTDRLYNEYRQVSDDLEFQGEQYLPDTNTYILASDSNRGDPGRSPVDKLFRRDPIRDNVGAIKAVLEPSQELKFENPPMKLSEEVDIDQTEIPEAVNHMAKVYFEQLPEILEHNNAELGEHGLNLEFTINAYFDPSGSEGYQVPYSVVFEAEDLMEDVERNPESSHTISRQVNDQVESKELDFIQREDYTGSDSIRHLPPRG